MDSVILVLDRLAVDVHVLQHGKMKISGCLSFWQYGGV